MFAVTVTFELRAGEADAFIARVRQQAQDSLQNEPDCVQFDVCVNPERPQIVFLYEIYQSPAAFDAHLASAHFAAFDAEIAPMVRAKTVTRLDRRLDAGRT